MKRANIVITYMFVIINRSTKAIIALAVFGEYVLIVYEATVFIYPLFLIILFRIRPVMQDRRFELF